MKKEIHCTIGGVELLREEVEMMYSQKLYIVAYTGVYQILFSQAQDRYHGQKVYSENDFKLNRIIIMNTICDFISGRFGNKVLISPIRKWWRRFWYAVLFVIGAMLLGMFLQFMTALSDFINYVVWG